jgi:Ca-activated chloride channel family protein
VVHAPVFDAVVAPPSTADSGFGFVSCEHGDLPLEKLRLHADIAGLAASVDLRATFYNASASAVEATYVFPVPELGSVSSLQIRTQATVIDGWLMERAEAHDAYSASLVDRDKAAILEQEREDIVTIRVGTIAPNERVDVRVTLHTRLSYTDGQLFFRFPLVVAPRHIPGSPLAGDPVGAGTARDTNLVPDASRVSPPTESDTGVELSVSIDVATDAYAIDEIGCTLRTRVASTSAGKSITIQGLPGQRPDRDLVLRIRTTAHRQPSLSMLTSTDGDGHEGTFAITVLPPTVDHQPSAARDVVVLVDTSASMSGWRLPAARRTASRIIDTLTPGDRFAVLTFADAVIHPKWGVAGLVEATDRNRFRAVEHLFATSAVGNPRLLPALDAATALLTDPGRPSILLVITAGQVGNEDQIVTTFRPRTGVVRVHTVGIGAAVNAGLLRQLAATGRGEMLLAESEDAVDDLTPNLRRLLGPALLTNLSLAGDGMQLVTNTISPARPPDVFSGTSVVITGRWRGRSDGSVVVSGTGIDGRPWAARVDASPVGGRALTQLWARAFLADLQRRYARCRIEDAAGLEQLIVTTSLQFGVLSRLTAFVAVSNAPSRALGAPRQVIQTVELPADRTEHDASLSPYAIEYARILASTQSPAASGIAPPPMRKAELPHQTAAYRGSAPAGAPRPPVPPSRAPTPSSPSRNAIGRSRSPRGQLIAGGVAVAVVAITVGVVGVSVSKRTNGSSAARPAATMSSSPAASATSSRLTSPMAPPGPFTPSTATSTSNPRSATAVDPRTGARLSVTVIPGGDGSEVDAHVSGIPEAAAVRLVVVGRDGSRHQIDEWVTKSTDSFRQSKTRLAADEIVAVAVEDSAGQTYVSAVLQ